MTCVRDEQACLSYHLVIKYWIMSEDMHFRIIIYNKKSVLVKYLVYCS